MQIQNTRNTFNITQLENTVKHQTGSLSTQANTLVHTESQLLHAAQPFPNSDKQPNIQKIMRDAFAAQRIALATQPSSSSDQTLTALNILEARGFKPASTATLKVRLTGKALGGGPKAEQAQKEIQEIQKEISERANKIWSKGEFMNTTRELLAQYREEGEEDGIQFCLEELTNTQTVIDDLEAQQTMAHDELQEVKAQYKYYKNNNL